MGEPRVRSFRTRASVNYKDRSAVQDGIKGLSSYSTQKKGADTFDPAEGFTRFPDYATAQGFDVDSLDKAELGRQQILFEIIMTEKDFVNDCKFIINEFVIPLRTVHAGTITPTAIDYLFMNIEDILTANEPLYEDLRQRRGDKATVSGVGDIFLKHFQRSEFRHYEKYLNNFERSQEISKDLLKDPSAPFAAFYEYVKSKPAGKGLDISSWLIKPVQRIMKYPLLCRDLLAKTGPDHEDRAPLEAAFDQINTVLEEMNEAKREVERRARGVEVAMSLNGFKAEGKEFIQEGELVVVFDGKPKMRERTALLYSDTLVLTKQQKGNKLLAKEILNLGETMIVDRLDDAPPTAAGQLTDAFSLIHRSVVYEVACADALDKQGWFEELQFRIDEATEAKSNMPLKTRARSSSNPDEYVPGKGRSVTISEPVLISQPPRWASEAKNEPSATAGGRPRSVAINAPNPPQRTPPPVSPRKSVMFSEPGKTEGDKPAPAPTTAPAERPAATTASSPAPAAAPSETGRPRKAFTLKKDFKLKDAKKFADNETTKSGGAPACLPSCGAYGTHVDGCPNAQTEEVKKPVPKTAGKPLPPTRRSMRVSNFNLAAGDPGAGNSGRAPTGGNTAAQRAIFEQKGTTAVARGRAAAPPAPQRRPARRQEKTAKQAAAHAQLSIRDRMALFGIDEPEETDTPPLNKDKAPTTAPVAQAPPKRTLPSSPVKAGPGCCPSCGHPETGKYCSQCGHKLAAVASGPRRVTVQRNNVRPRAQKAAAPASSNVVESTPDPQNKTYSLEDLQMRTVTESLDKTQLEMYLSAADFQEVFSMDKEAFKKLPAWKQVILRKKYNLF